MSVQCPDCGEAAAEGYTIRHKTECTSQPSGKNDVVGHKTIATGNIGPFGFPEDRHEPLTRAEADALWEAAEREKADRAAKMPDEQSAINAMFSAWLRLKELGWSEAVYYPKDGTGFKVIEAGSTGIFHCHYEGVWPTGSWLVHDAHDLWPSRPILYRLYPEDQAKYDAKMKAAAERFRASSQLSPAQIAAAEKEKG